MILCAYGWADAFATVGVTFCICATIVAFLYFMLREP